MVLFILTGHTPYNVLRYSSFLQFVLFFGNFSPFIMVTKSETREKVNIRRVCNSDIRQNIIPDQWKLGASATITQIFGDVMIQIIHQSVSKSVKRSTADRMCVTEDDSWACFFFMTSELWDISLTVAVLLQDVCHFNLLWCHQAASCVAQTGKITQFQE